MVERRDAGRSHSHQYFPVCDRWFRKIDELQSFITIKLFRSHCTHIGSPFSHVNQGLGLSVCVRTHQPRRDGRDILSAVPSGLNPGLVGSHTDTLGCKLEMVKVDRDQQQVANWLSDWRSLNKSSGLLL